MPEFRADIHLHADGVRPDDRRKQRHGERPQRLAEAICKSPLDVYASTEHNVLTSQTLAVHACIQELVEGGGRSNIVGFDGVELGGEFKNYRFHFGYIFDRGIRNPHRMIFPTRDFDIRSEEFADWREQHPGIVIVNHPLSCKKQDDESHRQALTTEMLAEGLIDGAEVFNGAMLLTARNENAVRRTVGATKAFLEARKQRKTVAPIAASDAHWAEFKVQKPGQEPCKVTGPGCVHTMFTASTPEDLLTQIRQGATILVSREPVKVNEAVERVLQEVPELGPYVLIED